MFSVGIFDFSSTDNIKSDTTTPDHTMLARKFASASTILLQKYNNCSPTNIL